MQDKDKPERGGSADGPRSKPADQKESHHERKLNDELDDSFPTSDPPTSTQPVGKEPPPPKPQK